MNEFGEEVSDEAPLEDQDFEEDEEDEEDF